MFKMRRRAGYSIFRRNFPEVSPFISARFFVSCTESAGDGRSGGNLGENRADVRKPTREQNLKTDFMKRLFRMLLTASGLLVFVGGGAGVALAERYEFLQIYGFYAICKLFFVTLLQTNL